MTYKNLIVERTGSITRVTINRPEVLNALNAETFSELNTLFTELREDLETRGVIITGAGDKAFVAGADISELAKMDQHTAKKTSEIGQNVFNRIEDLGKPVIAAVNGFALGGGLELAMACTFRYASEKAKMGQPEINLGTIPGYGGTQRLPRLVGRGLANELLMTGNIIDAQEAFRLGLVNKVLPAESLLEAAEKTMGIIIQKSLLTLRYMSQAVNRGLCMRLKDGLAHEANLFGMCAASEDMHEGMNAFLGKRKPVFKGK
ncbi:MAG: enoyl-CoA hydratase-related protein [Planctomycetota bacterium]